MKKLILLGLMIMPVFLSAEEFKLTVDDAVSMATENNITLARNQISLKKLELSEKNSWNSISPSFGLSTTYSNTNNPITQERANSLSASASVRLTFTPALFTSIKTAKLNYLNGVISYVSATRQIEMSVRKLFYSMLMEEENMAMMERNMETAHQRYLMNLDKYNRGTLSELNLLSSQVNYENLKPNLESLTITHKANIENFKQMLGLAVEDTIQLEGDLSDIYELGEINVEYKLDNLPAVANLTRQKELAQMSLLSTKLSSYAPSLSLSVSDNISLYSNEKWMDGDSLKKNIENWSLSASLSIPLDSWLPWSNGAMNITNQTNTITDLDLQIQDKKRSLQTSIETSLAKINQAKSQKESLERSVTLAQKTYDMAVTSYNHGSMDIMTLQNYSDQLMSAKINLQSQTFNLLSSVLDLEETLGLPFGTLGK